MAKIRPVPEKVAPGPEPANGRATLIKTIIIVGTFAAIAILSIITQGAGNARPGIGIIAARIVLLSACTALYFVMLYRTRVSRRNEEQKRRTAKK
jgi:hypothetical protein